MLFSSYEFLFLFLPFVLFCNFVLLRWTRSGQNVFLTLASLCFYAWGEPSFVFVMIASIILNWVLALMVDRYRYSSSASRAILIAMVLANLGILGVYKYLAFSVVNINQLLGADYYVPQIILPLGISFFTFQAISYVVDVYRQHGHVQVNPLNVAFYIAFFPQLIAGPIVRYETIASQIHNRQETIDNFCAGTVRFIIGLSKKMIIANNMAIVADAAFSSGDGLSMSMAWLGAIAYTFQIYFDFSAYSDMAIGLGRMFGFRFLENFNYPYIARSITDFWRRWHMSLGSWFRDYVYIPLGGNRVSSKAHLVFNLLMVWLLTGIWHGANWTFIVWGLMYFFLLVIEKLTQCERFLGYFGHVVTLLFVIIGWVIFRSEGIAEAGHYILAMFGGGAYSWSDAQFLFYLNNYLSLFVLAAIFSCPIVPWLQRRYALSATYHVVFSSVVVFILIVAFSFIFKESINPFIYSNF